MAFPSISSIEGALHSSAPLSVRSLHSIWDQRLPELTLSKKKFSEATAISQQLAWLQSDDGLESAALFTQRALDQEEFLLVCDVYEEAVAYWTKQPESRIDPSVKVKTILDLSRHCAKAKARLGFTRSARAILEPFLGNPHLSRRTLAGVYFEIGDILREEAHHAPDLATCLTTAEQSLEYYEKALSLDRDHLEALFLCSAMSLIVEEKQPGRLDKGKKQALEVLDRTNEPSATLASAYLPTCARAVAMTVLGRVDEAWSAFARLKDFPEATTEKLAEVRYNARFLAGALGLPQTHFDSAFPPLNLLVFSGHLPDRPGQVPRFPASAIPQVQKALNHAIEKLQAHVGLVSGAAGADLLFAETLLHKPHTKCHLVLPWSRDEFLKSSVLPYDQENGSHDWANRFADVLEKASTIRELGPRFAPDASDDVGWEFALGVMAGIALLTARICHLDVKPIAVWDKKEGREAGGTHAFVKLWHHKLGISPLVIDLPEVVDSPDPFYGTGLSSSKGNGIETSIVKREVKSMLFADVVGFSRLTESMMGLFVELFMEQLSILTTISPHKPQIVNTWGDAIYAVFDFNHHAGQFALEMVKMMRDHEQEWMKKGLYSLEVDPLTKAEVKKPISIRIGLHTGPVLAHINPVLKQLSFNGSHVNRAARIEPVAQPGEVYASEEFAAMAELGQAIGRASGNAEAVHSGFICEYAGSMELAKNYPGRFRIYRVIPHRTLDLEKLAQAAHALYCEREKTKIDFTPGPATVPWNQLEENYRQANRAQVADIPNKLHYLGYELTPRNGISPSEIEITPAQRLDLSRREHVRWMNERLRQGWKYGPVRDNQSKIHPLIVPWEELAKEEKQKDADTVHNMLLLIEKAGFQVRKLQLKT